METSRLGREQIETSFSLKKLVTSGVRVFTYLDDQEKTLNSPTDKVLNSLSAFADELEREKARARVSDAMTRKALAGHVTGGRVFGYDNRVVELPLGADGSVHRSHVERVINEAEAKVIVRIFELYLQGYGSTRIAHMLNDEGALTPKPQQGRKPSWSHTTVRHVLNRPLYRGIIQYNTTVKRNTWGQVKPKARPKKDWIVVNAEHLRIVPAELVTKVEARMKSVRSRQLRLPNGKLLGRPPGEGTKYLLAGIARCTCGARIEASTNSTRNPKQERSVYYGCSANRRKGKSVCPNTLKIPAKILENAVLRQVQDVLLDPSVIYEALDEAVKRIVGDHGKAKEIELTKQSQELQQEIAGLVGAIAQGIQSKAVTDELQNRETKLQQCQQDLEALHLEQSTSWRKDPKIRVNLEKRIKDWKGLLRRHAPQGAQILKKLVDGRLILTPHNGQAVPYYTFSGTGTLNGLIGGLVPHNGVSLTER
jgi:site-specific DNA recombinase